MPFSNHFRNKLRAATGPKPWRSKKEGYDRTPPPEFWICTGKRNGKRSRTRPKLVPPSIVQKAIKRTKDPEVLSAIYYLVALLDAQSAQERLEVWIKAYPNRAKWETHVQIAVETGLRRELVTKTFIRMGIRGRNPRVGLERYS